MATRLKNDTSRATQQMELMAGAVQAAKSLSVLAPQMLDLQRALNTGAAKTQAREADRLAKKYGANHPRVADARARAERMERVGQQLDTGLAGAKRVAETFTTDNVFHGYVVDENAAPASAHTVRVEFKAGRQGELTAKTNGEGYFRIELEGAGGKPGGSGRAGGLNSVLMSRMGGLAPEVDMSAFEVKARKAPARKRAKAKSARAAAAPAAAVLNEADTGTGEVLEVEVQILDPAGKLVYEDEAPPQFEDGQSVFRYYSVKGGAAIPGEKT